MIALESGRTSRGSGPLAGFDLGTLLRERERTLNRFAGMAPPITRLIAVPRAIPMGGRMVVVAELRLRDLAELQAYLEQAAPHPLQAIPPAWADADPATRRERLAEAWEAAESWPPRIGTAAGSALLAEPAGRAAFLFVALRRGNPAAELADALAILEAATPLEWSALARIAWGKTPREEIADELAPEGGPDKPRDWAKAFHQLVDAGLDYDQVADLTLSQWRHLASGGRSAEQTEEYRAMIRRGRAALKG